jgi:hypothetical protein
MIIVLLGRTISLQRMYGHEGNKKLGGKKWETNAELDDGLSSLPSSV